MTPINAPPPQTTLPRERSSSVPTFLRLAARFGAVRWWALGVFLVLLTRTGLEISSPWLMGKTLDTLEIGAGLGGPMPPAFVELVWLLAAVLVGRSIATFAASYVTQSLGQELENRFRTELFTKVSRLHFRYHDKNRSGKTIARSLRDMEKAKRFFREVAFGYAEIALIAVAVVGMAFVVHWSYGLVMLVTVCSAIAITLHIGGEIAKRDRGVSDAYDAVTTTLQENVAGARVVRAFGRESAESDKFGTRLGVMTRGWQGLARYWTAFMPAIHSLYNLAIPVSLLVGVYRLSTGLGSIGQVSTVLLYVGLLKNRVRILTRLVIMGQEAVASAARVFEVLDHEEEIHAPATPRVLPEGTGEIVIDNVHFGHRGDLHVLRGLSLRVPAGSSLGIIGPTGSGKSTLVSLLPRYYDPDRGRILIDGVDLRELDPAELRRQVGLVFQEAFLFSDTVAGNLRYGRPKASAAAIERAARQAAAHGFVTQLPKGYETMVGERGVSLSGGQRQRLTIARALVMNPRVLVFDDATAAVDAVTEKRLFEGIRTAAVGRTALIVSQRVTSVRWCDRIAVVEDGRVTSIGTHEELIQSSPLYHEIAGHQALVQAGGAS